MFLSTGTSLEEEEKEVPSGFRWEIPMLMSLHLGRSVSNGILFIYDFFMEIPKKT